MRGASVDQLYKTHPDRPGGNMVDLMKTTMYIHELIARSSLTPTSNELHITDSDTQLVQEEVYSLPRPR